MDTGGSAWRFECRSCGASVDPTTGTGRCLDCGGILRATPRGEHPSSDRPGRPTASMWDFEALLPFDRADSVSMGEGGTPLVSIAELVGHREVDELWIKDEGQNPTGSAVDRELSLTVTAIDALGAGKASMAAPGAAGQSFAAYAARAGLEGTVYLPSRAPFERKALCNVHGIELTVVQDRLPKAQSELTRARAQDDLGDPIGAFETPFRYLGATTIAFEIVAQLPSPPDAIVVPTGSGVTLVGIYEGLLTLQSRGTLGDLPQLIGVQPSGCAPIAAAHRRGDPIQPVTVPDTVCGELEWPDPDGGAWALEAVEKTNGTMAAISDDAILEMGVSVSRETGLETSPSAAAGPAAAIELLDSGRLQPTDSVVVVSTGTGGADLLRSHLETNPRGRAR
ncbi:MAG: pyridoxal-phosphate dependent enzyme [Halodesulfurarchaeum sp.]